MSKIETIKTGDGSVSLWNSDLDETYHSRHGAWNEAVHVFIDSGLRRLAERVELSILEVGFGTGLNCYLTSLAREDGQRIEYCGLEAFPLDNEVVSQLNYAQREGGDARLFEQIHSVDWGVEVEIGTDFFLKKVQSKLEAFTAIEEFDLVYYDAFGPRAQPKMWEKSVFDHIYSMMKPQGVFVTYCAKGQVRRDLVSSGFEVERLEGPPGKRHMLRGVKV